jgi:hypothetical protein
MPDVPGGTVRASMDMSGRHDACPDSGPDLEIEDVSGAAQALVRQGGGIAQEHGVDVIVDGDGDSEAIV